MFARSRRGAAGVLAAVLVTGLLAAPQAARAEVGYPNPLPDFSHPGQPHAALFHYRDAPIPLLVVYGTFNDLTNVSETDIADKFFPLTTFGTVANYYREAGIGFIGPIVESSGIPDNGVVVVDLGPSGPGIAQEPSERRRKMLELADPAVDFARYDTDGDGSVEDSELAVATVFTSRPGTDNCGQTKGVASGGKLDGKNVAFRTADGGTATNRLTLAHELAHQFYDLADLYGFGVGRWDIGGPTCGSERWFLPNSWHLMHLGWRKPLVATKDGYVNVRPSPSGLSHLIYDPERGTQDYFLVEARDPKPNTYDQTVPDSGVVIWRIDERHVRGGVETRRGVEVMRPDGSRSPGCADEDVDGQVDEDPPDKQDNDGDGLIDEDKREDPVECDGGNDTDAWNPLDTRTPQREMTRPWQDGTAAKVAVRAIGRPFYADTSNDVVYQAYLDVRGPGILVDPAEADGDAPLPRVTQGESFDFPYAVMNTGETTDTFEFTVYAPDGWTATKQTMTLAAGQRATATIKVTAPTGTPYTRTTLTASGRSTTNGGVRTDYQFLTDVTKRPVDLVYTGDAAADYSDPARLAATLTDRITGAPLSGRTVTFSVNGIHLEAVTGAGGVAQATWTAATPGSYRVTAVVDEDAVHAARGASSRLTITPEDLTVAVTSPAVQDASSGALTLKATQADDGHPGDLTKASATVILTPTLGTEPLRHDVVFDASGTATIPVTGPDLYTVTITPTGDYFTGPSVETTLALYDPDARITGTAKGELVAAAGARAANGTRIKIQASVSYRGATPRGVFRLDLDHRRFTAGSIAWLIAAGDKAVLEASGTIDGAPATVRATITDHDATIVALHLTGAVAYDGVFTITNGNLTIHD